MPRCHETVLEASQSYRPGWENRLTAIFATVLDQHPELASAVFGRVGLPSGEFYEAWTEEWVTPDRRVDMQVIAKDNDGGEVAQLWSENKRHGGAFSTGQREAYLDALDAHVVPGKLVTIVGDIRADDDERADGGEDDLPTRPGEPSPKEPRWVSLTWQWIAEVADRVGREADEPWGGRDWRRNAVRSNAPAKHRALCELVWYLEKEGYAVLEPFTQDYALALAHRAAADQACIALLERAAEAEVVRPLEPNGTPTNWEHGWGQTIRLPAGSWVDRLEGSAELVLWDSDDEWADEPTGKPVVAAGVSLDAQWYRPLSACSNWLARLRALGVSFALVDGYVLLYGDMAVNALVEHGGETLPDQARHVAAWAAPLLKRLLSDEFDPGPVGKAPKPARRKSPTTPS